MKRKNNYTLKEAEDAFNNEAWKEVLGKCSKFLLFDNEVT